MAVPGEIPDTIPLLVTVATAVFVLVQVPPVLGDKVVVLPTQIFVGPLTEATVGCVIVKTSLESETHPEFVFVNINRTVPADTAVIIP